MPYVEVLQKYAVFSGRAKRTEFWLFALIHAIIISVLITLSLVAGGLFGIVYLLYVLGTVIPAIAVSIRRLHDTGRSGWWLLIGLIPFGAFVLLVFYVMGSSEDNGYGPRPA